MNSTKSFPDLLNYIYHNSSLVSIIGRIVCFFIRFSQTSLCLSMCQMELQSMTTRTSRNSSKATLFVLYFGECRSVSLNVTKQNFNEIVDSNTCSCVWRHRLHKIKHTSGNIGKAAEQQDNIDRFKGVARIYQVKHLRY